MSTRERVHLMIDNLSEEQLKALLVLFGNEEETEPDEWDVEISRRLYQGEFKA